MYVTTNSMLVWKRQADENQQSARKLAKVSFGLTVALLAVVAYGITAQARYSTLCSAIADKSRLAPAAQERQLAKSLSNTYCS